MSFGNKDSNKQNKLSRKDIAIVALSVIMLVLLITIVFLSRQRDQMVAETLQNESEISTDDAIATVNSATMDYLAISEVNAGKWIELHNTSSDSIDISGIEVLLAGRTVATVSDGIVIKKDDYYAIDLSSNPGQNTENVLTIKDKDGNSVISILVPKLTGETSYGLVSADENIWGYMGPTRDKENSTEGASYLDKGGIKVSAPGGFYNFDFQLELQCGENEKIYYTTDGSAPTTDSQLYEDKIAISNKSGSNYVYAREALFNRLNSTYMPGSVDAGMIVRAIKVDASGNTTGVMSQAYYIGLTKDSDYLGLPVISITTDPENLFDYEHGIYVAGKQREDARIQGLSPEFYANFYNAWKKPAKIEYYEPTKDKTFELEADINIYNDQHIASRQKGFEISFEKESLSDYPGSTINNFISSDGKLRLTTNYEDNDLKIRNVVAASITEGSDIAVTGYQPCVLFLEGEYWGLYTIRTIVDANYIEQRYGVKGKEIVTHTGNSFNSSFLNFYEYATSTNLAVAENYEQIKTMMDVDNFIDYICFNIYLGNSAFHPENGIAWKTATADGTGYADGRWRFVCGDLSNTMYLSADQTPTMDTYLQTWVQGDLLFQSLLMNRDFCNQLNKRMKEMSTGIFDAEKCAEKVDAAVSLLKKPAMASYSRFNGNLSDTSYSLYTSNIKAYFEERSEYILKYTEELANKGGDLRKAREIQAEAKPAVEDETEAETEEENPEGEAADLENAQENGQNNNLQNGNSEGNTNG